MPRWRYRRRYRERYHNEDGKILFEEFKFYMSEEGLIDDKTLGELDKKLKDSKYPFHWSSEIYAKSGMGFKFYSEIIIINELSSLEYFVKMLQFNFTFTVEQFMKARMIIKNLFLNFDIEADQREFLEDIGSNNHLFEIDTNQLLTFNTWEDLVNELIKTKVIIHKTSTWDDFKGMVGTFLDVDVNKPQYKTISENSGFWNEAYHIFDVIEKRINDKNYRIALYTNIRNYENFDYGFSFYDDSDVEYNFVDKGRIYLKSNNKKYFLDMNLTITGNDGSITVDLDTLKQIAESINTVIGENDRTITPAIYRFYNSQVQRYNFNQHKVTEQEKLILDRYIKLLKANQTIKIDQIIITKNSISTEDDSFKIAFNEQFFNLEENFIRLKKEIDKGDAKYNFNILYELILEYSILRLVSLSNVKDDNYKRFTSTIFKVNEMLISVAKTGDRIKINDIFCRIDDVKKVLSKAICFNNLEDFEAYIKDVSYIGLEWKKLISNGVQLYLENPLFNGFRKIGRLSTDKVIMRFSLLWDTYRRNNIYLVVNNKQYLIKYKRKFISEFDFPERTIRMVYLKDILRNTLDNFDDIIMLEIVSNAIKEAKIVQQRGKELVEQTIKDIKAKEDTISLKDKNLIGFIITGLRTGKKYFVDKIDLNVFRYDDGKWNRRCVISDANKQRIFEDRLANRLINIYNENVKIHTLFN